MSGWDDAGNKGAVALSQPRIGGVGGKQGLQNIGQRVGALHMQVNKVRQQVNLMGSANDTRTFRAKLRELYTATAKEVKGVHDEINNNLAGPTKKQGGRKFRKICADFEKVKAEFISVTKQLQVTEQTVAARQSMDGSSGAGPGGATGDQQQQLAQAQIQVEFQGLGNTELELEKEKVGSTTNEVRAHLPHSLTHTLHVMFHFHAPFPSSHKHLISSRV